MTGEPIDALPDLIERIDDFAESAELTADAARALTDEIKTDAAALWDKIARAYTGRAWAALSYDSWDAYCSAEFASVRLRLPREEREAVVCSLRDAGLSNRSTAAALGISEGTVRNDLKAGAQNYAPAGEVLAEIIDIRPGASERAIGKPITGADGKKYPSTPKKPAPRRTREEVLIVRAEAMAKSLTAVSDALSGLLGDIDAIEDTDLYGDTRDAAMEHLSGPLSAMADAVNNWRDDA